MHSILQTSCDNISSKLQVTVKILQVIMTATWVVRRGWCREGLNSSAPCLHKRELSVTN